MKMTRTVTESRHNTPPDKISHQRKLTCLYCLCVMLFASNRCCSIPLHLLLTDLIESQGGSYDLIRILNRFGAVASIDTHRRYVQYKIQQKVSSGYLSDLNMDEFTIASVDNIDFLQRHSFVYCGDQSRSWHGTTFQVVQPLAQDSVSEETMDTALHEQRAEPPVAMGPAHKKKTRRSRSLTECKDITFHIRAHTALSPTHSQLSQLSYNHYTPLKSGHSLTDFHLTNMEEKEFKKYEEMALLYIAHRYVYNWWALHRNMAYNLLGTCHPPRA